MLKHKLYNNYKIFFETPNDGFSYFFGYYDKTPLNRNNNKLLAHRVSFDGRDVHDGDTAEVGYFDLQTKKFIKIDETLAWNWQQGSHLQWLPPSFENTIIYNNIRNKKFVSILYNINTKEKRIIPFPIYIIHPNGKEALAVNYERFYWCRPGYNYQNIKNKKWDKPFHKDDGIYKINLQTGQVQLLISISVIINHKKLPEFEINNNWLEHMMYNPSGDRFMFLHRWDDSNSTPTRLYTANSKDGSELFMYPDVRFYSHSFWKDNKHLSIWALEPNNLSSSITRAATKLRRLKKLHLLVKPIFRMLKNSSLLPKLLVSKINLQFKLLVYRDKTNDNQIVGENILFVNGHQSWSKDKCKILTDSYQDRYFYRHLAMYDIEKNKLIKVGKFYSQYNDNTYRCDLHPRFNLNNKLIIIDTAHLKKRKIIITEQNKYV